MNSASKSLASKVSCFLVLILATLAAGCGSLLAKRAVVTSRVVTIPAATNWTANVTNFVTVQDHVTVTNWQTNIVATIRDGFTFTNAVTNWVYEPNPAVLGTLQTIDGVASAVPLPGGQAVSAVLGLATVGLGWLARVKTRQAADHADMLGAVVAGVEEANKPEVKEAIAKAADVAGVGPQLHNLVQKLT